MRSGLYAFSGRVTKRIFCLSALSVLAGCATPIPFNTVTLADQPTITSDKKANLLHITGTVSSASGITVFPVGAGFVAVPSGRHPELEFHQQNQAEFIEVLRSELLRLKVFESVETGRPQPLVDFTIKVLFAKTFRYEDQEFVLDVVMTIEGGKRSFLKEYHVNSYEKSTYWETYSTDAYEGKVLAVRRLLERLVPDIQTYVSDNL